jgi:hypothetical protein
MAYELFDALLGVVNFGGEMRRNQPSHWSNKVGLGLGLDISVISLRTCLKNNTDLTFFFLDTKLHQLFN